MRILARLHAAEIVKLFGEALKPKTPSRGSNAKNVRIESE
jgi:hypothetical protein